MRGDAEGAGGVGDALARKAAVPRLDVVQHFQDGFGTVPVLGGEFQDFGLDGVVDDFFVGHGASLLHPVICERTLRSNLVFRGDCFVGKNALLAMTDIMLLSPLGEFSVSPFLRGMG